MSRKNRNGHGYAENNRNGYAECHMPHATYIVDTAVTESLYYGLSRHSDIRRSCYVGHCMSIQYRSIR